MSFYDIYLQYKDFDLEKAFNNSSPESIQVSLEKSNLNIGLL